MTDNLQPFIDRIDVVLAECDAAQGPKAGAPNAAAPKAPAFLDRAPEPPGTTHGDNAPSTASESNTRSTPKPWRARIYWWRR